MLQEAGPALKTEPRPVDSHSAALKLERVHSGIASSVCVKAPVVSLFFPGLVPREEGFSLCGRGEAPYRTKYGLTGAGCFTAGVAF